MWCSSDWTGLQGSFLAIVVLPGLSGLFRVNTGVASGKTWSRLVTGVDVRGGVASRHLDWPDDCSNMATAGFDDGQAGPCSVEGCESYKLDIKAQMAMALVGWRQAPKLACCSRSNAQH